MNTKTHTANALGLLAMRMSRAPWLIAALLAISLIVSMWGMRALRIDADLAALLPPEQPRMSQTRRLQAELSPSANIVISLSGATRAKLIDAAETLAAQLEQRDDIEQVQRTRHVEFWRTHALYYLPTATLERLAARVEARRKYEIKRNNPLFISLKDKPAPSLALDDLLKHEEGSAQPDHAAMWREANQEPYLYDAERGVLLLIVHPKVAGVDMALQGRLLAEVERAVARHLTQTPHISARFGGGVAKTQAQQRRVEADMGKVSLLGLVLVTLYLLAYFRSLGALALLLLPLGSGMIWTLGFAGAWFGTLSVLTSFVSVILMGLGIDHGIHLLTKHQHARATMSFDEALQKTFTEGAAPVSLAALTTLLGFLVLATSSFRAFHEFGVLAAFGMAGILTANMVLLPALLRAFDARGWLKPKVQSLGAGRRFYGWLARWPAQVLSVTLALIVAVATQAPKLGFEYSWRALGGELEAFAVEEDLVSVLGRGQSHVYLRAKTEEDRERLERELKAAVKSKTLHVKEVVSARALVPTDQPAKHALLVSLHKSLERIPLKDIDPDYAPLLEALKQQAPAPFSFEALPEELRRPLQGKSSDVHERLLLMWASESLDDGRAAIRLASQLDELAGKVEPGTLAIGLQLIVVEVISAVQNQTPRMMLWVFAAIFGVLLIATRRPGQAALCVIVAGATLVVMAGLMGAAGIKLNYFNMVLLAVTVGMAVDGAIHLVWLMRGKALNLSELEHLCSANVGALLTTALGFGALRFATHPGITSIADAALMGLIASLLLDAVALPALILLLKRKDIKGVDHGY